MKFLLVEDDNTLYSTIARYLRRKFPGAAFERAESAHEAIDRLRNSATDVPFDLVVSDYNLLGTETGAHTLEWIRQYMTYLEPRFLFFSGNDNAGTHGVPFFPKSDFEALVQGITQALAR